LTWRLRCRKGDARQYDCASLEVGYSVSHYKACEASHRKQTAVILAIPAGDHYMVDIIARPLAVIGD
jgi:hypothetical protein